jgi:hypothetical protein
LTFFDSFWGYSNASGSKNNRSESYGKDYGKDKENLKIKADQMKTEKR